MALPVLYSYWRSSSAWRVRIALAWKAIPYETRAVNLLWGEQGSEAYLRLNPSGRVPALHIDGVCLTQSLAIIEYLEETRPQRPLLPRDAAQRAVVRALALEIVADIQPLQNTAVLRHRSAVPAEQAQWAAHWIDQGLRRLEATLATTAGRYCVGDVVTLADVMLVPQLYNAHRFGVDVAPYPTVRRVGEALAELPEFPPGWLGPRFSNPSLASHCPSLFALPRPSPFLLLFPSFNRLHSSFSKPAISKRFRSIIDGEHFLVVDHGEGPRFCVRQGSGGNVFFFCKSIPDVG
eukprot:EG_transcript_15105